MAKGLRRRRKKEKQSQSQSQSELELTLQDLDKVEALIERFVRERATLDAQLNVAIQAQLDIIQSGLGAIDVAQTDTGVVRAEMDKVDRACGDAQALVKDFEVIDSISKCHINFMHTLEMVEHLESMGATLETLKEQLDEDRAAGGQASANLLQMHFQLSKLQNFRDRALKQSTGARKDVQETLRRYFIPLDRFASQFEEHLFMLCGVLLDILRTGDPSLIVKIAKIVYVEDQEDVKARALSQAQKSRKDGGRGAGSSSAGRSGNGNAGRRLAGIANVVDRQPRDYKQRFLKAVEAAVGADFTGCAESFEEATEMLDNLEWIFQDLALVQAELSRRMPPEWGIFDTFVGFYHRNLSTLLNKIAGSEPDGQTILKLLEWVKVYNSTMKAELGVDVKTLEPKLLEGRENELIEDYLKLIVRKLEEWMANLERTETKSFVERTESPEESPEGVYGMQGAVIMFQMVSQQIDVAADSGQGRVLASVVAECDRVMRRTREHWLAILDQETSLVQRARDPNVKDAAEPAAGLPDYIMALANDQIRAADYCEAISGRLSPLVSQKYSRPIVDALSAATDGFLDLAKSCLGSLVLLISLDVRAAFDTLFTKHWYDVSGDSAESAMKLICNTYSEYLEDCKLHLNPDLVEPFLEQLLDSFLADYLGAMAGNKKAAFKPPACFDLITAELGVAFNFFADHLEINTLQLHFDVLELAIALLQVDAETVHEDYTRLKRQCPDTPNWLVDGILDRRDDLSKKDAKQITDLVRSLALELSESQPQGTQTVMSKVVKR